MKKLSVSILVVLQIIAAGCNKADTGVRKAVFSIQPFQLSEDDTPFTRTSVQNGNQFIWADGDTVGIYPNAGAQVYFSMTEGAGASSAEFDGGGWDFKPSATYYSYYPFIGDIYLDRKHIPVHFIGQKQTGTTGISHIGPYDFMYTAPSSAADGMVNFSYKHLCCIIRPRVTLPAGTWTKLAVTAPTAVFATKGYFDLTAETPAIVPTELSEQIQIDLEGITLTEETQFQVYLMSAPVDLNGVEITVSVLNDQKKEFQCKKTPSRAYTSAYIGGLTCSTWTEVPQSMGMIIEDWGNGGSIGGSAE